MDIRRNKQKGFRVMDFGDGYGSLLLGKRSEYLQKM